MQQTVRLKDLPARFFVSSYLPSASYKGECSIALVCDHGLIVNPGKRLVLVLYHGRQRVLYRGQRSVLSQLCEMGALIQDGNRHFVITFDGDIIEMINDTNCVSHPCRGGIIVAPTRSQIDFVSFGGERQTIWDQPHSIYTVADEGLIISTLECNHAKVYLVSPGKNRLLLWEGESSQCAFASGGLIHTVTDGMYQLIALDGRQPAVAKEIKKYGACCNGLVDISGSNLSLIPFGSDVPMLLWCTPYKSWQSCDIGLVIDIDGCLILAKYDRSETRVVWRGNRQEWSVRRSFLVVRSRGEIVAVDLSKA